MANKPLNVKLPSNTHACIDQLVSTYGMTKTQIVILAVDRLTRDLHPDDAISKNGKWCAKTEAWILADNGDESGEVEQAG